MLEPFEEGMSESIIDKEEVGKAIKQTNPNKSPGPDNIHPKLIVETIDQSCGPLTNIFNKFLDQDKLPDAWNQVNITLIFKKGLKLHTDNFRSISLTSMQN